MCGTLRSGCAQGGAEGIGRESCVLARMETCDPIWSLGECSALTVQAMQASTFRT